MFRKAEVQPHRLMRHALMKSLPYFFFAASFSLASNLLILASPLFSSQVFDRVLSSGHVETLLYLTLITGLAFVILSWIEGIRSNLLSRLGTQLERRVASNLIELGVFQSLRGGAYSTQGLRERANIRSFVGGPGIGPIFDAPWTPIFLIALFLLHPALGIIDSISAAVLFLLALASEKLLGSAQKVSNYHQWNAQTQADSIVRNSEVIRAMGMLETLLFRWHKDQEAGLLAQEKTSQVASLINGASKFVRMFVQILVMAVGAYLALKGELTSGGMIASSMLLSRALTPVEQAIGFWRQFTSARQSLASINRSLAELPTKAVRTDLPAPSGAVSFEDVTYLPMHSNRPVVSSLNLQLKSGEAIGVVGPSGCGKSTFCKILTGIFQVSSGAVRFDGAEMSQWAPDALGRHIGYLPQSVELFPGTIAENIARMGEADSRSIVEAAARAGVHDLIVKFPQGYDTVVGEGGLPLSGGQRQRIGLARALFGNPTLVVLDEPNSNLDAQGESTLLNVLRDLKSQGVTIVVVAHRQQILSDMDRIVIMKDGRIIHAENGTSVFTRTSAEPKQAPANLSKEIANANVG